MQDKKINLLQGIYLEHLKTINNVNLTRREIDIITFFISGRSAKKVASFFSISPKTVENHTHNIMLKLDCNSRESIIDFIEKSDKLPLLRKFYTATLAQRLFDTCLMEVSHLKKDYLVHCTLIYWEELGLQNFLLTHIESSLKHAGISVSVEVCSSSSPSALPPSTAIIYIVPQLSELNKDDWACAHHKGGIFLLEPTFKTPLEIFNISDILDPLDLVSKKNYYLFVLEILKNLLPTFKLDKIISEYTQQHNIIEGLGDSNPPLCASKEKKTFKKDSFSFRDFKTILKHRKWSLLFISFLIGCVSIGFIGIDPLNALFHPLNHGNNFIRSDFSIPIESAFLNRKELISQIDMSFKKGEEIQTLALVGIGGAGKTTLARYYASTQKFPLVYELNAETPETLERSFEQLAFELATTNQDHILLKNILSIKTSPNREEKIIQFVKERLRAHSPWFLIYDNVRKFSELQKYFPKDPRKWGQGRIILTSRDSTIGNNKHINITIPIGELTSTQKLNLFIKIMSNGKIHPFTAQEMEDAKKFLIEIPPFPLDIVIAAYYLKTLHISYKNYLDKIFIYSKDFSNVQEKILGEAGDYAKTRYSIITVSLKHLIDINDDFKDLLLLISLLDSQNIPRDLLVRYKNPIVVDNFIYHLKKHSLTTHESLPSYHSDSALSIHRSTQAIILEYLTKTLNLKQNKNLVQTIATTLATYMRESMDKEDFAKMKNLYRQAHALLNHKNLLSDALIGSISGELGCFYYYSRHSLKANQLLTEALSILGTCCQNNHEKIAHFLVYLGNVYRNLGDSKKAKELFEKSLIIYTKLPTPHVGMARASGYLGVVHWGLGNFNQAKTLLEKSLEIHKKYPENPIGLAWSLAHLANVYKSLGDFENSKALFEQSLMIYKNHSTTHVGAAWVSGDLGDVYIKLGDFQHAHKLLEESLQICRQHFPENHVYVAKALVNLGIFYRETKNYKTSKSLLKKGLAIFEKNYGKNNVDTSFVLKNLALTYLAEGELKKAEIIMKRALKILKQNNHPHESIILEDLAEIYLQKSKLTENIKEARSFKKQAFSYLEHAFLLVERHFPKDSPHFMRIQKKFGKL